MKPMPSSLLALAFLAASCTTQYDDTSARTFAIDPLTGEVKAYQHREDVPPGWAVCKAEGDCPDPLPCADLQEAPCVARQDCEPSYVDVRSYPQECESADPPEYCDGTLFTACLDAADVCDAEDCGPPPPLPAVICPDGTLGGSTGRCVRRDDACTWEVVPCPEPCSDTVPECDLVCPDGTHNPTDECGRVHTCECVPNDCTHIPECDLACLPGTHNPVDELGCVHSCECVPDAVECTPEQCGPAPGCPAYVCSDGSTGGCTGLCYRIDDDTCGWEIRTCPPDDLKWYQTCGDPVCGGPGGHRDSGLPECTSQTLGEACSPEGDLCDPIDDCNSYLVCASSDPREQPGGCPISRRAFKQDIRYLEAEDRARIAEEILAVRLATYRYKAAPAREHLGFIIEDAEPSMSIDSDRDMVDLYGYTSMVVAALQAQADELAALRREVEELRAHRTEAADGPVCR